MTKRSPRHLGTTVLATVILLVPTAPRDLCAQDSVDSTKVAVIRELLELTKSAELMLQTMEAAIPAQRLANPRIPNIFWEEFAAGARRQMPRFVERVVPIYDAHFSLEDLQQLLALYRTPFGQRLLAKLPIIMQESMQAGQEWGMELGAEIGISLAERGIVMPPQ